jgi:hypothetical protein
VLTNATGLAPYSSYQYDVANASLPYLTPYVKALRPAKPAPGGTMTVTLGVRNDGAADGKVRWARGGGGRGRKQGARPPLCGVGGAAVRRPRLQ